MATLVDFHDLIERAEKRNTVQTLLKRWSGDRHLRYSTSKGTFMFAPNAFFASEHGRDSLEYIYKLAAEKDKEIPFTCLVDEQNKLIVRTLRGATGTYGLCDWEKGDLLPRTYDAVRNTDLKVMLGHTHPPGYGAVCSNVYFWDKKLARWVADYLDLRMWMRQKPDTISQFHVIMTPLNFQIGVFAMSLEGTVAMSPDERTKEIFNGFENGSVIYHPWQIMLPPEH